MDYSLMSESPSARSGSVLTEGSNDNEDFAEQEQPLDVENFMPMEAELQDQPTSSGIVHTVRIRHDSSSSFSSAISDVDMHDFPAENTESEDSDGIVTELSDSLTAPADDGVLNHPRMPRPIEGLKSEKATQSYELEQLKNKAKSSKDKTRLPAPGSQELCRLVIDYLISEGYKEVAETLCNEAGFEVPRTELSSLDNRIAVRNAIIDGKIPQAMTLLDQLCPGLLEANTDVRFKLHLQHLIELVRSSDIENAMKYVEENLSNDATLTETQLEEMEKAITLFAFDNREESPYGNLMSDYQRQLVSSTVNSAVLQALNRPAAPRIEGLFRMVVWAGAQMLERDGHPPASIDTEALAREIFDHK